MRRGFTIPSTGGNHLSNKRPAAGRCSGQDGFTLVELLVVLLVMSLVTGLAALAIPHGRSDALQREGDRLAALLDAARDRAAAEGVPLAWAPSHNGYTFVQPGPQGWTPVNAPPLAAHRWAWDGADAAPPPAGPPPATGPTIHADGITIVARGGVGAPGAAPGWLVFGAEPVSPPMEVTLRAADSQVTVSSDGISPFVSSHAQ